MTIEPGLKFYAVPSPSQYMALRSRSQTLNFLCLIFTVSVSANLLIDLNHVGMNRYKILKCFMKEKRNCRQAFLSGDRSYYNILLSILFLNFISYYKTDFQIPSSLWVDSIDQQ